MIVRKAVTTVLRIGQQHEPTSAVAAVWLTFAVIGLSSNAQTVTFDSLLQEMVDRDRIAMHPNEGQPFDLLQTSTHDTRQSTLGRPSTFTNRDFVEGADFTTKPLYGAGVSATERVFMSADGPGALTRMWIGGNPQSATYRFYVDGNPTPVLAGIGSNLIGNNSATFGNQLSFERGDEFFDGTNVRPGGMNLYAPIPYSQNLTITVDSGNANSVAGQWFIANHRQYANGTPIQSYAANTPNISANLGSTNATLANRTGNIGQVATTHTDSQVLGVGQSMSHAVDGAGAFRTLQVRLDVSPGGDLGNALRNTYVELTFDGQRTAQVPVGHFFGNGYNGGDLNDDPNRNLNPFDDWWRTVQADGTMAARWPMPFEESGEVRIVNRSGEQVQVDLEVGSGGWTWDESSMHFHAEFRKEQDILTRGRGRPGTSRLGPDTDATADWRYVTIRGQGVYVGDSLSIENPRLSNPNPGDGRDSVWWGEGDEKIYIDYIDAQGNGHTATPDHAGTGTEDYYGYAWAARGEYDSPFIAQPLADGNSNYSGQTVNGRVRMLDTIPFDESFKFDMEIWHGSDSPVDSMDYSSTALWYGRPGAFSLEVAADLGADFKQNHEFSQGGIPDTSGDGSWQFLSSSLQNPADLSATVALLSFGDVGDAGNQGYGGGEIGPLNLPAISDEYITVDGADNIGVINRQAPGYHEIAIHPSAATNAGYSVARWIASERVAGLVNVNGSVRNLLDAGDSVDFFIYVNGVLEFSAIGGVIDPNQLDETYFDFDAVVDAGDAVDFVVGNNGLGSTLGDEILLRAVILADYEPFFIDLLGDLNGDLVIDQADWNLYRNGLDVPMSSLGVSARYAMGDLDLDGDNDFEDFALFKQAYILANGPGSFAALFQQIPEPTGICHAALAGSIMIAVRLVTCGQTNRNRTNPESTGQI